MASLAHVIREVKLLRNWPTYAADHFHLLRGDRALYKLRDGTVLRVRPGTVDQGVFYEVWVRGLYTPERFEVGERDTVVDIGAHIGLFTVLAAKRATRGRVLAFEPTPDNFALLRENVQANGLANVALVNAAVADAQGERVMHLSDANTGEHSLHYNPAAHARSVRVRATTLEAALRDHGIERVDLLKLDCEGGEYDILPTAPDAVLRRVRRIALEYGELGPQRNGEALQRLLEARGFEVRRDRALSMLYARRR